jgi:hypothetical protein
MLNTVVLTCKPVMLGYMLATLGCKYTISNIRMIKMISTSTDEEAARIKAATFGRGCRLQTMT